MDDFRIIYRILKQIRSMELSEEPCDTFLDPEILKTTAPKRDNLVLKLLDSGYITGIRIIDGIDGQRMPHILWASSRPSVTLQGLEYLEENSMMKKAKDLAKGIFDYVK